MKITITEILFTEEKTSNAGKQYTLTTFKDQTGAIYKDVYGKFTQGQEVTGEWKDDPKFGRKFEVQRAPYAGGGGGGGRQPDPETRGSIERQTALKAAVEATAQMTQLSKTPELTDSQYIDYIIANAKKFTAFLQNQTPGTTVSTTSSVDLPPIDSYDNPPEPFNG